jgi:hypothetical protein
MTRVISIDPGLNWAAFAEWDAETGLLRRAGLVKCEYEIGTERAEKWREMAWQVDAELGLSDSDEETWLVVEVPQIYKEVQNKDKKGHSRDPNDLIDLAGVLGAIISKAQNGKVEWSPLPREWKGQIPKHVTKQRVDQRLQEGETECVEWPIESLKHNVYDALHLGIIYLEREGLREIALPQRYPNKS